MAEVHLQLSGRPETSAPGSSTPATTPAHSSITEQATEDDLYVPHVFDFIWLASRAEHLTSMNVPSLYLESPAVDSSVLIGHGASFTASRHAIPKGEAMSYSAGVHDGLSMKVTQDVEGRPSHVVYKTARIAFTATGNPVPRDKRSMSSAMMEIYAFVHPPLRRHAHVVRLLGLAWGSNPFELTHRLPVLVVEYADCGTLSSLQEKEVLSSQLRQSLCLDVALGLDILHRCGIVHGDVKSENVLIFSDPQKKYIAKVADFGFSFVEAAADAVINVGGTRPWKAPEAVAPVPRAQLKATDVFSFGLLVWRIAVDGQNPFDLVLSSETDIEQLKRSDGFKAKTKLSNWYPAYLTRLQSRIDEALADSGPRLLVNKPKKSLSGSNPDELDLTVEQVIVALTSSRLSSGTDNDSALRSAQADCFYGRIDDILEICLSKEPDRRVLSNAIDIIRAGTERQANEGTPEVLRRNFNHHVLSWQIMRDFEPAIQTFVFDAFHARQKLNSEHGLINQPEHFVLASFYVNGYGTDINHDEAIRLLRVAAQNNHEPSEAYACRFCGALRDGLKADNLLVSKLVVSSLKGSRTALQDLTAVAPEKALQIKTDLRDITAGVGADFFFKDNMLHGLAHWPWMDMLASRASVAEKLNKVRDKSAFKINSRGDRILHIAASCGRYEAVEALLEVYSVDVNLLNDQGETALLCACRAGQTEIVKLLVTQGANAANATSSSESPLHWLVSFEGDAVGNVGQLLLNAGASVELQTTTSISYSVFHGSIETDHQPPGSPLAWAVHHDRPDIVKFLLDSTTNPSICMAAPHVKPMSPLSWAAHFHHAECLKLMINALTEGGITYTYGPLIAMATASADAFSMIIRHGPAFRKRLQETFRFLLENSKKISFNTGIGHFGDTLLYFAASRASDEVVEYLLSPEVEALLAISDDPSVANSPNVLAQEADESAPTARTSFPVSAGEDTGNVVNIANKSHEGNAQTGAFMRKHINQACRTARRTPILESVRWNRRHTFRLLKSHGADASINCRHPFLKDHMDWTALHVFAYAGHNDNFELVNECIEAGVPIDGRPRNDTVPETPLAISIQNNAFHLAETLLGLGADVNALSGSCTLIASAHPLTILGHVVASTARNTIPRLKFLLHQCKHRESVSFIVEPERQLTALHRAALAFKDMHFLSPDSVDRVEMRRSDCDLATNRDVLYTLLQHFKAPEQLNARCRMHGRTALHLAVEMANVDAVKELVKTRGVDRAVVDENDETPAELARRLMLDGMRCRGELTELLPFLEN